ncbi:ParB/RepB/Spo0J family partition protein [Streptomyces sp. NPDC059489]|uniref:ParB/RepB/Spo0J family partition protein n=1 Tax=Streptomyces sp. NPDC059489 TaxID=3346849 RepID=UPI0036795767
MSGLEDDDLNASTAELFGMGGGGPSGAKRAAGLSDLLRGGTPPPPAASPVASEHEQTGARWIPVDLCVGNPRNPRDDYGDLSDLKTIVETQHSSCTGVTPAAYLKLWPEDTDKIPSGVDVVLITGNRRLRASRKYGREKLLVVIDDTIAGSKARLLRAAYDENTGRLDFDPVEEAKAALSIVDQYPTAKEACAAEGWTASWVSQRRAILRLHPDLQALVRSKARGGDGISLRKARWLGARPGIDAMGADQQLALLDGYPVEARKQRKMPEEPSQSATAGMKIPSPSAELTPPEAHGGNQEPVPAVSGNEDDTFTAVNHHQDHQPDSGAGGAAADRFTAVNQGLPTVSARPTTTLSAVHILRELADSLSGLPLPEGSDVVDRAKAEEPESAQVELARIKGWVADLEELLWSGDNAS